VIAETNGLSKAADLLEQAFGFGNHCQALPYSDNTLFPNALVRNISRLE
jgi:hypothetical protein